MALITLSDEVVLKYIHHAATAHIPVDRLIERQLARFADTPITERQLVLGTAMCQRLEQLLGAGATKDPAALVGAVKRWAGITVGDIRLDFSPAQLAEIALRAEKQGKSPEAIVEDIVAQLQDQFFYGPVVAR